MLKQEEYKAAREKAVKMIRNAGVVICKKDIETMDIADFGLSNLSEEGAQILTLFQTEKVACRVIALFEDQTEPEHWHQPVNDIPGKEETLRIISGELRLYVEGENTIKEGHIPDKKEKYYTCRHEIIMGPCDTLTILPGEKHWFQGGKGGAVFYTMSTTAKDAYDPFSDPGVVRITKIRTE